MNVWDQIAAIDFQISPGTGDKPPPGAPSTQSAVIDRETSIRMALTAWAGGLDLFLRDQARRPDLVNASLDQSRLGCDTDVNRQWPEGLMLTRSGDRHGESIIWNIMHYL